MNDFVLCILLCDVICHVYMYNVICEYVKNTKTNQKCFSHKKKRNSIMSLSVLRRGGGRNRSSNENVRAVAPPGACGLLRLNIDGFRIPKRPKMVRGAPGVVAVDCGAEFVVVNCNCSRNDG